MIDGFFVEFSIIVIIALLCAGLLRFFKQPLIIGYILAGVLISPYFFNLVNHAEAISNLAEIGIALLLFLVGLNLNPKHIKDVGIVSLFAGLGQIFFTFIICYFIAKLLSFPTSIAAFIAIALTFSSTIIVTKLLSDKGDMDSLYGKISVGFLIIQDIVAIFSLIVISSISNNHIDLSSYALTAIIKGILITAGVLIFGIYVLPRFIKFIAESQEFLLLFSIGWCLAVASVFSLFGFSVEIGALLAGVVLSISPYRFEISAKLRPLRDFFIILFFVLLGSQMIFSSFSTFLIPIIVFSVFTLIGKPLIIMILMGLFNYTKRTGFLIGITLSQISEFSFIVVALGVKVGQVPQEILSLIAFIGLITMAGSTYFILYVNKLYDKLSPYLNVFEKKNKKIDEHKYHEDKEYNIILFGLNRIGFGLLESFKKIKKDFLVVDFNPDTILDLARKKVDCRYGDASDSELLNDLNLDKVKMVVSTIPNFDTNFLLVHKIRKHNKKAIIIIVSHDINEAMKLYRAGATYILMPHFLGGSHTSAMIEEFGFNSSKFLKKKVEHISHLKKRRQLGHNHPKHSH